MDSNIGASIMQPLPVRALYATPASAATARCSAPTLSQTMVERKRGAPSAPALSAAKPEAT